MGYEQLPPHLQRMTVEHTVLGERLGRLAEFVGTETFRGLPNDEQEDLTLQHHHMSRYHAVLGRRIERQAKALADGQADKG